MDIKKVKKNDLAGPTVIKSMIYKIYTFLKPKHNIKETFKRLTYPFVFNLYLVYIWVWFDDKCEYIVVGIEPSTRAGQLRSPRGSLNIKD